MKIIATILGLTLLSLAAAGPPTCSIQYCGTNGPFAPCMQTNPPQATFCSAWSTTAEARLRCAKLDCSGMSCYFIPLLASDGNFYCTPCHIHKRGCRVGFHIYGPVDGAVSRQEKGEVEDANIPDELEERVSRDVEEAVSRDIAAEPICSMTVCTRKGANAQCRFTGAKTISNGNSNGNSATITCLKFSFTQQSKQQCSFLCPLFCLPEDLQPVANTGEKFCNECLLRKESCGTNYKTFGPVKRPIVTPPPGNPW